MHCLIIVSKLCFNVYSIVKYTTVQEITNYQPYIDKGSGNPFLQNLHTVYVCVTLIYIVHY